MHLFSHIDLVCDKFNAFLSPERGKAMNKEQYLEVEFILPSSREDLIALLRAVIVQKMQARVDRLGGEKGR